jgi:hypothetical protein
MLEKYVNTFSKMQKIIAVVTLLVQLRTHQLHVSLAFFVAMQCGAILGAFGAARLRVRG